MTSSNLVQYSPDSSEGSTPHPDETLPPAADETEAGLPGGHERSADPISRPLSTVVLKKAAKRKQIDDELAEAAEKAVPKRRKRDGLETPVSEPVTEAEVGKQKVVFKKKITETVVETEKIIEKGIGDEMDIDTETSERPVIEDEEHEELSHGTIETEKVELDRKKDADMSKIATADGVKWQKKTSETFFGNLYHQRCGMMNLGRLPAARETKDTDSVYASWRDGIDQVGVRQTVTQQRMESFFQHNPNMRDAKRRLEFVKSYMDRTRKGREKKWASLSLVMRLNVIGSLRVLEEKEKGDDSAWTTLRKEVKKYRGLCEVAQYHMNQPENWEQYDGDMKDERLPDEGPTDDDIMGLFATSNEEEEDTRPSPPTTKERTIFDWERFNFTPAQKTKFDTLCAQIPINDPAPDRELTKGQWKAEEFRFLYEWMSFKDIKAVWPPKCDDTMEMGRAHKTFFTDFLFQDGKVRSLCRGGHAIHRQLRKCGGERFEVWIPPKEGRGRGKGAVVGDEMTVGGGTRVGEGVVEDDDEDESSEGVVEDIEEDTETNVEVNKGGFPTMGGKNKEDVKKNEWGRI
ncbi:hypothetical protein E6O75_ATG02648 [Venturia nashicola]|uniref:Uncharacterized protein n=1 Tax=Venturia nashicola TaxID=86259 RepID=A0A4Z1P5P1_9PEZI|nr:hypothetical protein E6O75_ATG02648 [Venturia nashicola]